MSVQRTGLTVVELLIVAVMIAVVAAVVVPPLADSARDERPRTADFHLGALRSVIATYRHQHGGANPVWDAGSQALPGLTGKTDASGTVQLEGEFGPYLVEIPENPFTGSAAVKIALHVPPMRADVTPGPAGGWIYDEVSGQIWLDSNVMGEFTW